ncbi:MAG: protein kinase [Planctomycetes bacterium]|nr:protein kinase [Planctomycetota bacterium]
MPSVQSEHPSLERLAEFIQGRLTLDTLMGHMKADTASLDPLASLEQATPMQDADDLPAELRDHPRYRIFKLLGKGGMGEVYLAEHRLMERMVALKVIHRGIMQDPHAVERFRTEVKAAARLSHPNIVIAYDAEQAGDAHFLVMEYIEGVSLARYVEKRGPLSIAHACNYIRQAALGLQHAHEHGMVHRDIKPQNLMLTRKGQIKILDFGLARFARSERITDLGTILGTPDYIAPEQVTDARRADIRADIYSLGCTLYYLLTGRTPFPSGSVTQKVMAHVDRTPQPIQQVRPDVPAELARIIEKMMAKSPADRYQTPAEAAQALLAFSRNSGAGETMAKPSAPTMKLAAPEPAETKRVRPKSADSTPAEWDKRWLLLAIVPVALVAFAGLLIVIGVWLWGRERPDDKKDVGAGLNPAPALERAKAPRLLIALNQDAFWDPDYRPVRAILDTEGIDVKIASTALTPARPHDTRLGGPVKVDLLIQSAQADDFDAVYFPGALTSEYVGNQPGAGAARRLIGDMLARKKIVASLCTGIAVLVDAKVLRGVPAARGKKTIKLNLKDDDALWDSNRPVVVAGPLITGGDFEHAELFAKVLAQQTAKRHAKP